MECGNGVAKRSIPHSAINLAKAIATMAEKLARIGSAEIKTNRHDTGDMRGEADYAIYEHCFNGTVGWNAYTVGVNAGRHPRRSKAAKSG